MGALQVNNEWNRSLLSACRDYGLVSLASCAFVSRDHVSFWAQWWKCNCLLPTAIRSVTTYWTASRRFERKRFRQNENGPVNWTAITRPPPRHHVRLFYRQWTKRKKVHSSVHGTILPVAFTVKFNVLRISFPSWTNHIREIVSKWAM